MPGYAEIGYLTTIFLLDKGIVTAEKAISGEEILQGFKSKATTYFNWVGEEKFRRKLEHILATANCPDDSEKTDLFNKIDNYSPFARNTIIDWDQDVFPRCLYEAKYWMFGGDNAGVSFRGGIEQDLLVRYFRENPENKDLEWYTIESMADIKHDIDLWAFVNTWLEKNWRK